MRFKNKTVLVTGAGGGIGRAICQKFTAEGANIFATDMNEYSLNETLEGLQGSGRFATKAGNITSAEFCDSLPAAVAAELGSLDVVVNNAGIIRRGKITDTSDADWHDSMAVNVEAVFRLCRAAIPIMQTQQPDAHDQRGAIVNVASCWGVYPGPDHVAYCTSKAAVAAMTQCLGRDHAGDGIRVNAVCPNEVNTPMLRSGFEIRGLDADSAIQTLNQSVPLGRIAEAEDIADCIAFLASSEARYVCGALLEVNGAKPVG